MPRADPAGDTLMDDQIMTRLARELAEAIGGAVSHNPGVEACREKARAAGYELRVSLEAEIGFGSRQGEVEEHDDGGAAQLAVTEPPVSPLEITPNDRRFLRALRIAAEEPAHPAE
ncbi:MAG: hypothetical protein F4Y45_13340 [Acidobacteria bacterium]|nr:hypothetical protein [Acidobacteriota bacterium]MXZ70464.1 hypothetical protein [Acidobacteriota bacterium]MYD70277.1 hypothetical protein [Acidobacteriota bacterium]MYJ04705.1 hypothetical protein [Acidobacteriota bacterium]